MRKKILSVLGILVFAGLIYGVYRNSSVEETDTSISKTGFYFDTVIKITLYNSDDADYLDGCFALADKYEVPRSNQAMFQRSTPRTDLRSPSPPRQQN